MAEPRIRKGYVDTSEGQVHYRYALPSSANTDKAPIVFLHKSASSSASWSALMLHFVAQGHACYAPDMPGFGMSFDPAPRDEPYALSWFSGITAEALRALSLLGPASSTAVHLVGHHSGAALGPQLAVLHPASVRSLTLIGPSLLDADERAAWRAATLPFNQPVEDGSHFGKTWDYLCGSSHGQLSLRVLQREALDHSRAWEGRTRIYNAIWAHDGIQTFRDVGCAVLALCAEDDVLCPYFWRVKHVRPDVRAELVTGGNFSIDVDAVGCAEKMDAFFASLGTHE